jgi:tight adherence protein B
VTLAFGYGVVLAVAGWLAAAGITRANRVGLAERLGPPRRTGMPRRVALAPPRALRAAAEARSWPRGAWSLGGAAAGCVLVGAVVGHALAGPVAAVAGGIAAPAGLDSALRRRHRSERTAAEQHLREVILALAAATRSGLSIRRAVAEAARNAGPPLDVELRRVLDALQMGEPLERALDRLAGRLDLRDIHLVTTVLSAHRRTGGDLATMLEQAADVVGDRVSGRREVRALTAQGRASGAVLAVLPVAFVALLSGTGGEALDAFYRSSLGAGLLGAGLLLEVLGFLWIRRIVRRAESA